MWVAELSRRGSLATFFSRIMDKCRMVKKLARAPIPTTNVDVDGILDSGGLLLSAVEIVRHERTTARLTNR